MSDLAAFLRRVDPLEPGARYAGDAPAEVATALNDMLERLEHERRTSGRRRLAAQEAERRDIAHRLHGEVGQLLAAALLQLEQAQVRPGEPAPLEEARRAAQAALDEVSALSRRLRPLVLDDLGLADALVALATAVARRGGQRVVREIDAGGLTGLDHEEEVVLLRIAQEALAAVVRRGSATTAWVRAGGRDGVVELVVADDGRPAAPGEPGVRAMREWAVLVGAGLQVAERTGGGAEVTVRLAVGADGAREPL